MGEGAHDLKLRFFQLSKKCQNRSPPPSIPPLSPRSTPLDLRVPAAYFSVYPTFYPPCIPPDPFIFLDPSQTPHLSPLNPPSSPPPPGGGTGGCFLALFLFTQLLAHGQVLADQCALRLCVALLGINIGIIALSISLSLYIYISKYNKVTASFLPPLSASTLIA